MTQVLRSKYAGDVTPKEAWDILENDGKSILIDCRTDAEWSYVGAPNLSQIAKMPIKVSWKVFPEMDINPEFQTEITAACPDK
ncbi:MAG TPA: rhodanese-like domain-containing protein, partial [Rhodospirillales bacterium]|nr:rhodanese-like domain-containing protein [Rhodospirillales bacterium]